MIKNIKALAVFCGSSLGNDEAYMADARAVGKLLATHNIRLVYGGSRMGMMGTVADSVLNEGGQVTGVLPTFIKNKEIAHEGLTELIEVDSMQERKMTMHNISDATIIMPGGYGTLDKMFEFLTWAQLGIHKKPIGIYNSNGFYNHLIQFLDGAVANGFLRRSNREILLVEEDVEKLLFQMDQYTGPEKPEWMKIDQV